MPAVIDYLVLDEQQYRNLGPASLLGLSAQLRSLRQEVLFGGLLRVTRESAEHYTVTPGRRGAFIRRPIRHVMDPALKHLGPTFEITVRRGVDWGALRAKFRRGVA